MEASVNKCFVLEGDGKADKKVGVLVSEPKEETVPSPRGHGGKCWTSTAGNFPAPSYSYNYLEKSSLNSYFKKKKSDLIESIAMS